MTSLTVSDRVTRVALVTAGLSLAGGVVGGACSLAAVALIAGIEGGIGALASREFIGLFGATAAFGVFAGMIGTPVLSWAVLRRVPLGRAALFGAIGTIVGAVVGELTRPLNPFARTVPAVLAGALLGFIAGGVVARLRTPRRPTTIATELYDER